MFRIALARSLALAVLALSLLVGRAAYLDASIEQGPLPGEVTVLDTATGVTCTYTSGTPRTYIGLPIVVADSGAPLAISSAEVHFVALGNQNWEDVRIRVQFWEYVNPGLSPLFSVKAGAVKEVSIGPRNYMTGTYSESIRFATPVTFQTSSFHGLVLNLQGRINGEYVDTNGLTPCLRYGAPFAVGSVALTPLEYGYYRNADQAGRVTQQLDPFNFLQTEYRYMGNYSALMIKLYALSSAPTATPTATATPTPTPTPVPTQVLPLSPQVFVPLVER